MTAIAPGVADQHLIEREACRVEDAFRRDPRNGRRVLTEILNQSKGASGVEKTQLLDFGARLVTRLRERDEIRAPKDRLRIWDDD